MKQHLTVVVCDACGNEVPEKKGAVMRINPADGRREAKQADLCDDCMKAMPGVPVKRRGRRPAAV